MHSQTRAQQKKIEEEDRKTKTPRPRSLPSPQYAYLQLPFFSWFKKDGKAPGKMLFWEVHQSILNCDYSSKINKLIIFLGLLEHSADPSRCRLDWDISPHFFSHHTYQRMALKLQPWNSTGSSVFNWQKTEVENYAKGPSCS